MTRGAMFGKNGEGDPSPSAIRLSISKDLVDKSTQNDENQDPEMLQTHIYG
jgi:hypothetical protein